LDYAVGTLSSKEIRDRTGIFDGKYIPAKKKGEKNEEKIYRSEVPIVRKGELVFPIEIQIVFEDGHTVDETWDGKKRWTRYIYERPSKLKSVHIDPQRKVLLDINFINNSRILKPKKNFSFKSALCWMFNFQDVLTWISF
jgi:hypothetical protein